MKINFVISRLYNQIHFVENMSEWSEYTRKQENVDWIKATGSLTDIEKSALRDGKKFFEKYNYSEPVGKYRKIFEFFADAEKSTFDTELRDLVGEEYSELLIGALKALQPRFEKIWLTQEMLLGEKKKIILENLHEKEILNDFKILFDGLKIPRNIDIFLVINTRPGAAGGANIGPGKVTLECSSNKIFEDMMSILWHEISHLLLRNYVKEVFELIGGKAVSRSFINEVISHSLFGFFGVLTSKYYNYETSNRVETRKLVDRFVETGITSKSGKKYIDELPFGLGHYYLSKFIKEKLEAGEIISVQEMSKMMLEVHKKA